MASKIGVYFDVQNIGGGLDVEALAEQVRSKWSDLTPVVKVLPMLSVAEDEVRADIEANGLDGVLFCGASPRDEAAPWQLPVQVEHVNLREQCVLAYKNPDYTAYEDYLYSLRNRCALLPLRASEEDAFSIPAATLERYRAKRKEKVYPVVCEVSGNRCPQCGMELSIAEQAKLSDGTFIECDSCRRILFKRK